MSGATAVGGHESSFAATKRSDAWWKGWVLSGTGLVFLFGYLTVRAFTGMHYFADPYLSPVASPPLFTPAGGYPGAVPLNHAWLGYFPSFWPSFLPQSPAFFIPGLALAFRGTCYYYRKAYYRAFTASPPGCAVSPGGRPRYHGETRFLLFQNLHRYAMYIALLYVVILSYDAVLSFFKDGQFGIGVGSIVLTVNAILIASYTFGCHSLRHVVGGRHDCMSCGQNTLRYGAWKRVSWFNGRHMQFAWASLVWVGLTDAYVRLVSMGVIHDFNTW